MPCYFELGLNYWYDSFKESLLVTLAKKDDEQKGQIAFPPTFQLTTNSAVTKKTDYLGWVQESSQRPSTE